MKKCFLIFLVVIGVTFSFSSALASKAKISESEKKMIVQLVQHEVGLSEKYYMEPKDFHFAQRLQIKLIINRMRTPGFPNTAKEVIQQRGQFENWQKMYRFSPSHNVTVKNLQKVLSGKEKLPQDILFQMSFPVKTGKERHLKKMRSLLGNVVIRYSFLTRDKRIIYFLSPQKKGAKA